MIILHSSSELMGLLMPDLRWVRKNGRPWFYCVPCTGMSTVRVPYVRVLQSCAHESCEFGLAEPGELIQSLSRILRPLRTNIFTL